MADLLNVEVVKLIVVNSVEALAAQKSLFMHVESFYRAVGERDSSAPEGPEGSGTIEAWLGPLVAHVQAGGSAGTTDARPLHAFLTQLVKWLAAPKAAASPLPISNVTLRVEGPGTGDAMPRELSGNSGLFVSLLAGATQSNPLRTEPVPPLIITGNFGKTKRVTVAGGSQRKRAEASAWVYSKWLPPLSAGSTWSV